MARELYKLVVGFFIGAVCWHEPDAAPCVHDSRLSSSSSSFSSISSLSSLSSISATRFLLMITFRPCFITLLFLLLSFTEFFTRFSNLFLFPRWCTGFFFKFHESNRPNRFSFVLGFLTFGDLISYPTPRPPSSLSFRRWVLFCLLVFSFALCFGLPSFSFFGWKLVVVVVVVVVVVDVVVVDVVGC